jgi:hypothetical protein
LPETLNIEEIESSLTFIDLQEWLIRQGGQKKSSFRMYKLELYPYDYRRP